MADASRLQSKGLLTNRGRERRLSTTSRLTTIHHCLEPHLITIGCCCGSAGIAPRTEGGGMKLTESNFLEQ